MTFFGVALYLKEKLVQNTQWVGCFRFTWWISQQKSQTEKGNIMVCSSHVDEMRTQYYDSQFMGHTTAIGSLHNFKSGLSKVSYGKLLHVSVDDPEVNWRFFTLFSEERDNVSVSLPNHSNCWGLKLTYCPCSFLHSSHSTGWKPDFVLRGFGTCFMIPLLGEKMTLP